MTTEGQTGRRPGGDPHLCLAGRQRADDARRTGESRGSRTHRRHDPAPSRQRKACAKSPPARQRTCWCNTGSLWMSMSSFCRRPAPVSIRATSATTGRPPTSRSIRSDRPWDRCCRPPAFPCAPASLRWTSWSRLRRGLLWRATVEQPVTRDLDKVLAETDRGLARAFQGFPPRAK
ncbi:MAG: hypothetical protein MZW92_51895 [Comamonadaceae bacterium]|nr:hypothetical protein [Comamonadaceae bacterium]